MKLIRAGVFFLMAALVLGGCASQSYSENVVAVVNGETITKEEIAEVIKERKLLIDLTEALRLVNGESSMPQREAMIQAFGINEEDMTPGQKRFFEGIERSSAKIPTENEALNILLVEEVLYQEAVKEGHDASIDKVKEIMEESKRINMEAMSQNEEALKEYNEYVEKTASIYHQYGFASEDDYLNKRIDRTARAMAINTMNYEFDKVMTDKLPNIDLPQMERGNAWEDYGEYLLSKAKVKILKPEYQIEHYGESWSHGKLDLKAASK
ncbi:MAG TPA: hypothetical protein GX523_17060 [Desulfitobacterium dehalogenans]|uniref:Lipoprotein n=1 Tax=Desulfitobacterium dehalogenans TaxID=36854 RepID=A0A7C7D7X6_9FIRM|nr:hypothetical protein [Desulfitobacterium dehalogenans]